MRNAKFKVIGLLVLEISKGFYHIWAWRSCDQDHLYEYKLSFPLPKGLALIGKVASQEKILTIVEDNGWTPDTGAWVSYKLTL